MHDTIEYILGNITQIIEKYNYLIIFLLMTIESSFIPFPSEIVMIPAGYLVAKGTLSLSLSIISGVSGSIVGALINYQIAKLLGYKLLHKYGKYFLLPPKSLNKIQDFFTNHGVISTFSGRLIPGVRQYISFPAGLVNMPLKKFIFFTALGSMIWVVILVLLGVIFHNNQLLIAHNLKLITLIILVLILILVIFYIVKLKKFNKLR
jgi:membrane protein DedA with SNARE-associated domain